MNVVFYCVTGMHVLGLVPIKSCNCLWASLKLQGCNVRAAMGTGVCLAQDMYKHHVDDGIRITYIACI